MFFIFAFITYSNTEWEAVVDNVLVGGGVVITVVVVVIPTVVVVVGCIECRLIGFSKLSQDESKSHPNGNSK